MSKYNVFAWFSKERAKLVNPFKCFFYGIEMIILLMFVKFHWTYRIQFTLMSSKMSKWCENQKWIRNVLLGKHSSTKWFDRFIETSSRSSTVSLNPSFMNESKTFYQTNHLFFTHKIPRTMLLWKLLASCYTSDIYGIFFFKKLY